MRITYLRCAATVTAVLLAMLAVAPLPAIASGEKDLSEVRSYKLTAGALSRYEKATSNLRALPEPVDACGGDESENDGESIDESVAKIESTPGAKQAIESTGMGTREYVVFTWAIVQAGMAAWLLDQPGAQAPADVSLDNADFYRKNEAALKRIGEQSEPVSCEAGDEEDDYSE